MSDINQFIENIEDFDVNNNYSDVELINMLGFYEYIIELSICNDEIVLKNIELIKEEVLKRMN